MGLCILIRLIETHLHEISDWQLQAPKKPTCPCWLLIAVPLFMKWLAFWWFPGSFLLAFLFTCSGSFSLPSACFMLVLLQAGVAFGLTGSSGLATVVGSQRQQLFYNCPTAGSSTAASAFRGVQWLHWKKLMSLLSLVSFGGKAFSFIKISIFLSVHCFRLVSRGKSSSFLRSLPWDWAVLLCLWVLDLDCVNSGHKRYSFVVKFWSTRRDLALLLPTLHFVGASVGENCFYITWSSVRFLLGFFPFFYHRFMCHYVAYTLLQCLLWLTLPPWQLQTRPLSLRKSPLSFFLHAPPYTFCLVAFWGQFSPSWHAVSRPSSCLVIVCLILYAGYPGVFLPLSSCRRNASNNNSNIKCGRGWSPGIPNPRSSPFHQCLCRWQQKKLNCQHWNSIVSFSPWASLKIPQILSRAGDEDKDQCGLWRHLEWLLPLTYWNIDFPFCWGLQLEEVNIFGAFNLLKGAWGSHKKVNDYYASHAKKADCVQK